MHNLTSEDWNIHGYRGGVWLVETHPKVSLSTQQQQDEHSYVHQAHSSCSDKEVQDYYSNHVTI